MLKTIEGVFRNGKVELLEPAPEAEGARVVITFLNDRKNEIDLASHGISPEQAADLRGRLSTFAEDWNRPDMDIYDED